MNVRHFFLIAGFTAASAFAQVPGQPAPAFAQPDVTGNPVSLSGLAGRYVVLEWTNPDCPFVRNHYNTRNMQALQQTWGAKGVVWVTINSTSRGHREFKTPETMAGWMKAQGGSPSVLLVDGTSAIAKAYGVRTTPEMFVIDPAGNVIYAGAIDDRPSTRPADPPLAHNYVQAALTQAKSGGAVAQPRTTPYGCSLKY